MMGTQAGDGLREIELRDVVTAAERTVAHWEHELGERIAAAKALDGVGGWMSKLLGSYDADVDAAIEAVKQAQAQLHHAKGKLVEARARLDGLFESREQRADAAVAQVMELEGLVAQAKGSGGPLAAAVLDAEARIVPAEARVDRLRDAVESSLDLVMELTRVRGAVTRSRPQVVSGRVVAYHGKTYATSGGLEGGDKEVEVSTISEPTMAWEEVMLALGVDTPGQLDEAVERLLAVDGLYPDPLKCETRTMAAQNLVEPMTRSLKATLAEAEANLHRLQKERAAVVGVELLDMPSGRALS